jgi:hypothetical protein
MEHLLEAAATRGVREVRAHWEYLECTVLIFRVGRTIKML